MVHVEQIEIRLLNSEDYEGLRSSMLQAYKNWAGSIWEKSQIERLLKIFPEGQIALLVNGKIAGCALSLRVDYTRLGDNHSYSDITTNSTFGSHSSTGDVLYGIEVFISPEFRGLRLGRRLYDARKELCERLNLKSIVFGGRIPNYHKYAETHSPKQYLEKVKSREIHDPVLAFQLSNDFHIKRIIKKYIVGDKESMDHAVLLQWINIFYEPNQNAMEIRKPVVRLGLIQWQMRSYKDLDELFEHAEFFIDAVSGYKSDFALFPEFFNAPLMSAFNHLNEAEAIRKLAEFTDRIVEKMKRLAVEYNVNIITGSMPKLVENNALKNVGFLCRRNGTVEGYEKIHVTPDESKFWGLVGGDKVKIMETDCGPIGVLICYDVEFPELGRILAEQGMNILFVPFLTDTQNGYSRVRHCARARAVENECYVAIAGSVGNLPKVENMDIQYSQSAVFTPCDFAFPSNGIKAESTPNTEMILVADVDLDLLVELHNKGSVRNLKDRRRDVYSVQLLKGN